MKIRSDINYLNDQNLYIEYKVISCYIFYFKKYYMTEISKIVSFLFEWEKYDRWASSGIKIDFSVFITGEWESIISYYASDQYGKHQHLTCIYIEISSSI